MGELKPTDHIAAREDMRPRRPQLRVDLDAARRVRDASSLETQTLQSWATSRGNEQCIAFDILPAVAHTHRRTRCAHLLQARSEHEADTFAFEHLAQNRGRLGMSNAQRSIATIKDRDRRAQAREALRKLDADRATTNNQQASWQLPLTPDGLIRPVRHRLEARNPLLEVHCSLAQTSAIGTAPIGWRI
jgi:hypothetical protein